MSLTTISTSSTLAKNHGWPALKLARCYGKAIDRGFIDPTKTTLDVYVQTIRNQEANAKHFLIHVKCVENRLTKGTLANLQKIAPNHQDFSTSKIRELAKALPDLGALCSPIVVTYWKAVALNVVPRATTLNAYALALRVQAKTPASLAALITKINRVLNFGNKAAAYSLYTTGKCSAFEISNISVSSKVVSYSISDSTNGTTYGVKLCPNPNLFYVTHEDLVAMPMQSEEFERGMADPKNQSTSISSIISSVQQATRASPASLPAEIKRLTALMETMSADQAVQAKIIAQLIELNRLLVSQLAAPKPVAPAPK